MGAATLGLRKCAKKARPSELCEDCDCDVFVPKAVRAQVSVEARSPRKPLVSERDAGFDCLELALEVGFEESELCEDEGEKGLRIESECMHLADCSRLFSPRYESGGEQ